MTAAQPRIKLQFEGTLGEHLVEHNLQKCWCLAKACFYFVITLQLLAASLKTASQAAASSGTNCLLLSARKAQRCKPFQTSSQRYLTIQHVYQPSCCSSFSTSCCSAFLNIPCAKQHRTALSETLLLSLQLCEAFDLLGADSDLLLELDGFTVISNSPLSLFRDGDTVTIRSKGQGQKATVPVTNGGQAEGGKRKRSEVALAAGDYGNTFD